MKRLSSEEKKENVLKFITESAAANGYPPTVREVCAKMGFSSSATGQKYIDMLKEDGLISNVSDKSRTLKSQAERYKEFDVSKVQSDAISMEVELDNKSLKVLNDFCVKYNLSANEGIRSAIRKLIYFID